MYEITLGLDVGTELGYLDRSLYGSNDEKLQGLLFGGSLGSTDSKLIQSDEVIKLGISYAKVLGIIPVNVDGITLGMYVGAELRYLDKYFDGYNYGKIEGLLLGGSLVSTDLNVHGHDQGNKLGSYGGKVLGTILVNVFGINIGINVGIQLVSSDGSFDGFNDEKLEVLLLEGSLEYIGGKFISSHEGIKLEYTGGKVFGNILVNVDLITLGIYVGTELVSLDESLMVLMM